MEKPRTAEEFKIFADKMYYAASACFQDAIEKFKKGIPDYVTACELRASELGFLPDYNFNYFSYNTTIECCIYDVSTVGNQLYPKLKRKDAEGAKEVLHIQANTIYRMEKYRKRLTTIKRAMTTLTRAINEKKYPWQ